MCRTLVAATTTPAMPFPNSHPIHLVGFYSPSWNRWTETLMEQRPPCLSSASSSPHLRRVALSTSPYDIPGRLLVYLTQFISLLLTSLELLSITQVYGKGKIFEDALTSLVCRCGSLLRRPETSVDLSEAAIDHLVRLPNLSHWSTAQEPRRVTPTPTLQERLP